MVSPRAAKRISRSMRATTSPRAHQLRAQLLERSRIGSKPSIAATTLGRDEQGSADLWGTAGERSGKTLEWDVQQSACQRQATRGEESKSLCKRHFSPPS